MSCPRCGTRCICAPIGEPAGVRTLVYDGIEYSGDGTTGVAMMDAASTLTLPEKYVPRRIAVSQTGMDASTETGFAAAQEAAWRDEVANRVLAHRAKRKRKFDPDASLSLGFESVNCKDTSLSTDAGVETLVENLVPEPGEQSGTYDILADEMNDPEAPTQPASLNIYERMAARAAESRKGAVDREDDSDNVIAFPRAVTVQTSFLEDLAEPITPRILDVPEEAHEEEHESAPPPLATIRLDEGMELPDWIANYEEEEEELALPLQVAPLGPRVLSSVMDGVLVLTASALFSLIVLSVAKFVPQGRAALAIAVMLPTALWAVYHYVFLVFGGITPGMIMAQLELCSFEGCIPMRRTRASRAAAMLVSCVSLGLGFAWAMVDEDSLGWHDRITRTYLRQS